MNHWHIATAAPETTAARPARSGWTLIAALALAALGALLPPVAPLALAQARRGGDASILERLQDLRGTPTDAVETLPSVQTTPVETPVDPDLYRLFPGDQLHLGIWGEAPNTWTLVVGPEGDLITPKAGPVRVSGLSLSKAERTVIETLRPFYGRAPISLRLLSPARFLVPVTGMVGKPGLYEATSLTRLTSLLDQAGGVRPGGSIRRIAIRPADAGNLATASAGRPDTAPPGAPRSEVDLLPWALAGVPSSNPPVEPGTTIEVQPQGASVRIIGPVNGAAIQGATPVSGRVGDRPDEEPDLQVEVRPGDTVGLLLDQVGGLSDRATGTGTLRRQGAPPASIELTSEEGRAIPIQEGDTLEVGYTARWIYVTGSVRVPGRVPFYPGLHARDYVYLAGGPTEIGRTSGWSWEQPDGTMAQLDREAELPAGSTIRVPERRAYKATSWLAPLSTATALLISVVALTR